MGIIDIIIIVLVVLIAVLSARKGFLLSLFNLCSYFIAAVLVKLSSAPVSGYVYTNYVQQALRGKINELMPAEISGENIYSAIENTLSALPEEITAIAKHFGIYPSASAFNDFAEKYDSFSAEMIEQRFIEPIATGVISLIVAVVLFIVFVILLRIAFYLINKWLTKEDHPIIKKTNAFFGAALGVLKGTVFAGIICVLLNIIAPLINNAALNDATVNSYFCNLIAELLK